MMPKTYGVATDRINVRQICFIMAAFSSCGKLLLYPVNLSYESGNGLWLAALIDYLLQTLAVWAVAYACSKSDKTFYERLTLTFGRVAAKIIMWLFAAFFIAALALYLGEHKLYVQKIFYDTVPSLVSFLPFFIFSLYAGGKKFNNVGRAADICFPIFVLAFAAIFGMSLGEVRLDHLLPLFERPAGILRGAVGGIVRFTDAAWLLMFMGRFPYKKGDCTKITLSYAAGGLAVVAFTVVFYGVYSVLAANQFFAISQVSVYFSAISVIGRIDFIVLYALELVMLFALVLNVQACSYCVREATGYGNGMVISTAVNALLFLIVLFTDHYFYELNVFYGKWMYIPFVLFALLVPVLSLALRRGKEEPGRKIHE